MPGPVTGVAVWEKLVILERPITRNVSKNKGSFGSFWISPLITSQILRQGVIKWVLGGIKLDANVCFFLNFLQEIVHEIWVGDIATPVI